MRAGWAVKIAKEVNSEKMDQSAKKAVANAEIKEAGIWQPENDVESRGKSCALREAVSRRAIRCPGWNNRSDRGHKLSLRSNKT